MRRIQEYVTVTRAAEMLGVCASTLRNSLSINVLAREGCELHPFHFLARIELQRPVNATS